MSLPEFKSHRVQVQEAYKLGRRNGFWIGLAAAFLGRAIIDAIGALT